MQICLLATARSGCLDEERRFIIEVIASLRAQYGDALIVVAPEANLGKEASNLEQYLPRSDPMIVTMAEIPGKPGFFGFIKDNELTMQMCRALKWVTTCRKLAVAENLIGIPNIQEQTKHGAAANTIEGAVFMCKKLKTQLNNARIMPTQKPNKMNPSAPIKYTVSGKGQAGKTNDDLSIALQEILVMMQRFEMSLKPAYVEKKRIIEAKFGFNGRASTGTNSIVSPVSHGIAGSGVGSMAAHPSVIPGAMRGTKRSFDILPLMSTDLQRRFYRDIALAEGDSAHLGAAGKAMLGLTGKKKAVPVT